MVNRDLLRTNPQLWIGAWLPGRGFGNIPVLRRSLLGAIGIMGNKRTNFLQM